MTKKRKIELNEKDLRKSLNLEIALHCWDNWLTSVDYGRKVLRYSQVRPSLEHMRDIAKAELAKLKFHQCTIFELYWLCCVFADYNTELGFMFDNLILPNWFPLPFGFAQYDHIDFRGQRIYPPAIWSEADRKFWFFREPMFRCLPLEIKAKRFQNYPEKDSILVLPANHQVRKYIKKGRPITPMADGETLLE